MEIAIFIIVFIVSLILTIWLSNAYTKKREIGNTQIIIALCITAISLLLANKIESFEFGDFKIKAAFNKAQNKAIFNDITLIPVDGLVINEKENYFILNEAIAENRPDALSFFLGYKNYGTKEIDKYLEILGKSNLQYIIFEDLQTRRFVGIVEYNKLIKQLNNYSAYGTMISTEDFKNLIKNNETNQLKSRLHGYISNDFAVLKDTKKLDALTKMEKIKADYLPVTDSTGFFVGIVKRDRLASSLLIEISNSLKSEKPLE